MNIKQADNFYKQDEKKYKITKNKEFLTWFKKIIKNGYHSFTNLQDLQDLINNIAYWYEIKYPEREMELEHGIIHTNFTQIETLSKNMNFNQLMYRLPHKQLLLINCHYRAFGGGKQAIYNSQGQIINYKDTIFMLIKKKIITQILYL